MTQPVNQSEHKFVEWALDVNPDKYNVIRVSNLLQKLNRQNLHGLDVGGNVGLYAKLVCDQVPDCKITVLDKSPLAIESFIKDPRLNLVVCDYFDFNPGKKYDFIIFKTVLHHFIGNDETTTTELQRRALYKAQKLLCPGGLLLIEENFYQGLRGDDLPGRLIFAITKQRWIASLVRKFGANTAGEGVRFRSYSNWCALLESEGYSTDSLEQSPTWGRKWPLWQRIPLLSSGRFQGVIEAQLEPQTVSTDVIERRRTPRFPRWQYILAIAAFIGPAISTCTLAEF